jgi:PAS domain-containing protein
VPHCAFLPAKASACRHRESTMDASLPPSISASLPCGICGVDHEGTVLGGNPALERLLGWRLSEWCDQPHRVPQVCIQETLGMMALTAPPLALRYG